MNEPLPTGPAAVLAVAANRAERDLLADWMREQRGDDGPSLEMIDVSVDVSDPVSIAGRARLLSLDESTAIVPVRVKWSPPKSTRRHGPRLRDLIVGDPRNPGPTRARYLAWRRTGAAQCLVGESAAIGDLRARYDAIRESPTDADPDGFGAYVLRMADLALDVAERRLEGRRYKVPRAVAAGVRADPVFEQAIRELATDSGRPASELSEKADEYLDEMVATPSTFFIDWAGALTRWIVSLGYGEIVTDPQSVERARAVVRDHPTALLWTHKSHVDAIALLSVMYDKDFPWPHQMGGINMAFRGLAGVSRGAGTIFIRRSFSDNDLYKLTLRRYLGFLMAKRFPFSWSFEGTRSRTGKLMPPKYGLLKYVVDAADATGADDLHVIPVAVNYDLIGEVSEHVRQDAGQKKQAESMSWFVDYLKRLRSPMGRVYLDFGEAIVVNCDDPAGVTNLHEVAFEVARRVNALVPVTLPALMCTALLGSAPQAMTRAELDRQLLALIGWLQQRDIRMASSFDQRDERRLTDVAELVFDRGIIRRVDSGPDTVYVIGDDQHGVASYYRNNTIHYFLDKAMTELALMRVADIAPAERLDAFWSELRDVRDMLKFEFFHTPTARFADEIDTELRSHDPDWRESLTGDRSAVERLVASMTPLVAHATILPIVEAYSVVVDRVARLEPDETIDQAACVADALGDAEQAYLQQRLTTRASIGKQMFTGAFEMAADRGLLEPGSQDRRRSLASTLRADVDRLAALRSMAASARF